MPAITTEPSSHPFRQFQYPTVPFDCHGNRIWRTAQALLDSEHVRRSVGQTAVPFGVWLLANIFS
jgi:hypothetical protein